MERTEREEFERELNSLGETGIKGSRLRREYEEKVHALAKLAEELAREGLGEEQIARALHEKRRALGADYKKAAPPLLRAYIYYRTAKKYGDPLGPNYEALRKTKTDAEIIASASRPIRDLDERISPEDFARWFAERQKP